MDYKLINSSLQQLSTTATKKMGGGRETMDINVIRLSDPAIIHHWCKATRICWITPRVNFALWERTSKKYEAAWNKRSLLTYKWKSRTEITKQSQGGKKNIKEQSHTDQLSKYKECTQQAK